VATMHPCLALFPLSYITIAFHRYTMNSLLASPSAWLRQLKL